MPRPRNGCIRPRNEESGSWRAIDDPLGDVHRRQPRDQISIVRGSRPAQPHARSFIGGFRTTAAVQAASSRGAIVRNPYMSVNLSRPFRAVPIRGHILLFEPLQSPSFRPDPQSLKAVARRASQEWPSR